jgi:hypothetical protein
MRITFNNENLLSQIRKTILNQEFNHSFGNDSFYCPNETTYDRYSKIDAHSVFAVAFYFSSKKALSNQEHVLSAIAQYYSIFHLSFALISLNFNIEDKKLEKIRHSQLKNVLKNLNTIKVISENFIYLYEDLQEVREYLNYINVPNGYSKFIFLRRGHIFKSRFFSEDISIPLYPSKSMEILSQIIDEYFDFLHTIEESIISKKKTNGERPLLFKCIRRISNFDWYGEDFLNNSFSSDTIKEVNTFLSKKDIYPDEHFFDDF